MASEIQNGDAGIFVTCDKGQEGKCVREMCDLLTQVSTSLWLTVPDAADRSQYAENDVVVAKSNSNPTTTSESPDMAADDIEANIKAELESLNPHPAGMKTRKFTSILLDVPCVSFIRVDKSLDPAALVHQICSDAASGESCRRSRYIKRMTPMTVMRKLLGQPSGIEQLCGSVLPPYFHTAGGPPVKFAIRPTIRNNNQVNREEMIRQVAAAVGARHSVDLKHYDKIILVDVYRNVVGMSVVGSDYDQLKRYNLSEIYERTPKTDPLRESAHAGTGENPTEV